MFVTSVFSVIKANGDQMLMQSFGGFQVKGVGGESGFSGIGDNT